MTMPARVSTASTTGVSNVMPNAMNMVSAKLQYLSMSGVMLTPAGVKPTKVPKIDGKTMKYANAMPQKNSNVDDTMIGIAIFFSCLYNPGATNAHI